MIQIDPLVCGSMLSVSRARENTVLSLKVMVRTIESIPSLPIVMSRLKIERQRAAVLAAAQNNPWQRRRKTRTEKLRAKWRFQRCEYVKTKLLKTDGCGWDLLADQYSKNGLFVITYLEKKPVDDPRLRKQQG